MPLYTRAAASAPGVAVGFPSGSSFGTRQERGIQEGIFTLTFSAPGAVSTSYQLSTADSVANRTTLGRAPIIR